MQRTANCQQDLPRLWITSASSSTIRAAPWLIWERSYQRAQSIPLMRHHKKKPPEVLRLRTFRGSYSTKLIKTVSLNGHICHICKQTSSNFQTFLETSMDFSMDFSFQTMDSASKKSLNSSEFSLRCAKLFPVLCQVGQPTKHASRRSTNLHLQPSHCWET